MKRQDRMEQELIIRTDSQGRAIRDELATIGLGVPEIAIPTNDPAINNLIDDGDFNWSDDAYTTTGILPGTAGDGNNRAYGWFRMQRATALLAEDDAHSLKGAAHSLFGGETADTPRWNKTEGWAELGETGATPWDICAPLPNNFVTPGMRFRLQMLVRLRTATTIPGALQMFWLLQDNTAATPDVIKGSAFTLNGNTFGPLGATTRTYKLIVDTDYGGQVESTVKVVNNAPAVLTPANGVALSWPRYPGFTNVTVYVTVGGSSFIVGKIGNGANATNDVGQTLGSVGAVPTVTDTIARAYALDANFRPTTDWNLWTASLIAPQTYDFSQTTGKQWLRGGVIGLMGDPHQLQIDRVGLSTGHGVWTPSDHDKSAKSLPSTSQTSSTQGPPSSGGSEPPDDGEGRIACSTLETIVDVCDKDGGNVRQEQLGAIDEDRIASGVWLLGRYGKPNRVRRSRTAWSNSIITIKTANGAGRRCSPSDLWLIVSGPETGTSARRLCEGMEVWTRENGSVQPSEITLYSVSIRGEEVRILETDGDRTYWAGNAGAHNAKILFGF
jgi:hypothetical protein